MGFLWFGRNTPNPVRAVEDEPPVVERSAPVAEEASPDTAAPEPATTTYALLKPDEALQLLKDGNAAFVAGTSSLGHVTAHDLEPLQGGQHPIAVIVGCADSRTPPTILFNQGLGRLFIIRVAGNTVDGRGLASIVYAVKHLHCPLVVVMGHSGCGAVAAAEAIVDGAPLDPSLEEMITPIIPAVLAARRKSPADPARAAVEENARWVAQKLRSAEGALSSAVDAGQVRIVAAVKDMTTGRVDFYD